MSEKNRRSVIDIAAGEPERKRQRTSLAQETKSMERRRRLNEQDRERQFGSVKAREHRDNEPTPGEELGSSMKQHAFLNSQRFDGTDSNLNPEPPLNTDARREFDNKQREQQLEKQLRLGNMPRMGTAPTPQGP